MLFRRTQVLAGFLIALCAGHPASAGGIARKEPPKFTDYPIRWEGDLPSGTAKAAVIDSPQARKYRTTIRFEFGQPTNFSGHYRIAIWGCGTDCRNFAIVDKKSGRVYTMPGVKDISGLMGNGDERVDFRRDSRLLVVSGCFNDDCALTEANARRFYYVWDGTRLKKIHAERLLPDELDPEAMKR